jgi:integral membrane protein
VVSDKPGSDGVLTAYRVLAVMVGLGLLTLVLVGLPLKYAADQPDVVKVVGPGHGFLYVVYFLLSLQLWQRERWEFRFAILVLCAGFVPFLSFYAERQVTYRVRASQAGRAPESVSVSPT